MKKILAIVLALAAVLACFAACGGGDKTNTDADTETQAPAAPVYADATEVLTKIFATYTEENKFPIGGGDEANMSMEAPAKYDYTLADELNVVAALPATQSANIEDAATALNMMMSNNFTGAAYLLKEGADAQAFADDYKAELANKQWMCGMPEKYVVVKTGNYVVTAYGLATVIDYFKTQALTLEGAELLVEGDITE